jgi:hypothetical protein
VSRLGHKISLCPRSISESACPTVGHGRAMHKQDKRTAKRKVSIKVFCYPFHSSPSPKESPLRSNTSRIPLPRQQFATQQSPSGEKEATPTSP